ncbi:SRPBCC family protein [Streptomyces finlayi]|uniref:SRPBCC family protein n=1 Tax=Streptomyces finlayi TaxID=67296 RepID=A0A7G7BD42_9ACTN|nr:SRPBCC family protein [Streptomyces finlayi]QNE73257.1 SRPBCC family protein [Streptomyces finlayi]QNE78967.1 SRPBCC family protein [Streptomyces finlayi]
MSTTTFESTAPNRRDPLAGLDLTPFTFTRRCWVDSTPDSVYQLISDVSLIETWSPSASAVSYEPGDGPWVGARFSGRNRRDGREWVTHSEVVQADPGSAFAFVVGGAEQGIVRWNWHLYEQGVGSIVQQSWRLLRTDPLLGNAPADLHALRDHMASSAEATLLSLAEWIARHRTQR